MLDAAKRPVACVMDHSVRTMQSGGSRFLNWPLVLVCLLLAMPAPGPAAPPPAQHIPEPSIPDGIHVLDGSYVLNVGELQVNITNHGLIGSQYSEEVPYREAPSAQWPSGSGDEYLWGAGLWVGGRIGGMVSVTTGQYERELRPGDDLRDTIYEARDGYVVRPIPSDRRAGNRYPPHYPADDDGDGQEDEDWLNGRDDDGDGLVDEDFAQLGDQMFTCTMFDDTPLAREMYPDHRPLGIRVIQRAAAWDDDDLDDIVALDFEITNVGLEDVDDVYVGMFVDCVIRSRDQADNQSDDLAGYFRGAVRAPDGLFYRANIGYMRDAAQVDPLPGCLGFMLIDHTIDFLGRDAPFHYDVGSFQIFAANAAYQQNGEPQNDEDRYNAMALPGWYDQNTPENRPGELKYLMSSGPFQRFTPGSTLNYRVAMIVGDGLQGMLETAVKAAMLGAGAVPVIDLNWGGSYETRICLDEIRMNPDGRNPLIGRRPSTMNESCAGWEPHGFEMIITEDDFVEYEDGRFCITVNMDNCEECFRTVGHDCTPDEYWEVNRNRAATGTYNKPWTWDRLQAPPRPDMRVVPGDRQVEVFWDDRSELAWDRHTGMMDFESYRVWRVANWVPPDGSDRDTEPPTRAWGMIAEYDIENFITGPGGLPDPEMPLGRNTGLEVARYMPACLSDPRFTGLAEAMQAVVNSDLEGRWVSRPDVRLFDGSVAPGMEELVRWETHPTVLDTFFAVAERSEGVPKRGVGYYHHVDREVHNGFRYYYSVVARDHTLTEFEEGVFMPTGNGLESEPGNFYLETIPRTDAQTPELYRQGARDIYVYPNPATRQSLGQNQPLPPNLDDPTGLRVNWANLPLAHNTIHIFTASGDLVETIQHDGHREGGSTSWNLVSRNGQEVVSGIYLYVVKSDDPTFQDFQGRFVLIR